MYGNRIERSDYNPFRSVISDSLETSAAGNVILRVGREHESLNGSWHQTEHVVLTRPEAVSLATALLMASFDPSDMLLPAPEAFIDPLVTAVETGERDNPWIDLGGEG
jgi:hypothetical protein